jgi:hypothetical protein
MQLEAVLKTCGQRQPGLLDEASGALERIAAVAIEQYRRPHYLELPEVTASVHRLHPLRVKCRISTRHDEHRATKVHVAVNAGVTRPAHIWLDR